MYACILEIGRGFFEGGVPPSSTTAYRRDPPPYNSRIDSRDARGASLNGAASAYSLPLSPNQIMRCEAIAHSLTVGVDGVVGVEQQAE